MNRFHLITIFLIVMFISGCGQQEKSVYQSTSNGLKYQFHASNHENQAVQLFDVVEVYLGYRTSDSLLFSSYPQSVAFQVAPVYEGDLMEGLMLMHKGDSATFVMNTKDFYVNMMQFDDVPEHSKNFKELLFDLKVVNIIPETSAIRNRRMEFKERKGSENVKIATYLQSKKYPVEPLENGLYYIPVAEGTGNFPVEKNTVQLHYTASFLDGQLFSTSYENQTPLSFTIGSGEVIDGLEAGVMLTKMGGKAKLIIPSRLAYGGLQRDDIKPFTPLVFEIEILNITATNF